MVTPAMLELLPKMGSRQTEYGNSHLEELLPVKVPQLVVLVLVRRTVRILFL